MDNLYEPEPEPEPGERSPRYPTIGRAARDADGRELGSQHVRWSELNDVTDASGVVTQTVVGERIVVRRVLLKAGATCAWNTTDEELLQVVDGAVRLRVGAEQQDVDDAWGGCRSRRVVLRS